MTAVFSADAVENLASLRLIRCLRGRNVLTLTAEGKVLLSRCCADLPEDVQLSYRASDIARRCRLSKLALTAYRAGLTIRANDILSLRQNGTYFMPSAMRTRGANPWSNSRVGALLRLGDQLCAAHYVCADIGNILLTEELNTFTNNTARIKNVRHAFIFAGESYESVLAILKQPYTESDGALMSYADAFRRLRLPSYLLACGDTGALQLQIMAVPDYRSRFTRAALRTQYAEAPMEHPDWDAMFQGMPFVMAADMDLKRLDRSIEAARGAGYRQIILVCLKAQAEAVFYPHYRDTGMARVFTLNDSAIEAVLDHPLVPYAPPRKLFETETGEVIDIPRIRNTKN